MTVPIQLLHDCLLDQIAIGCVINTEFLLNLIRAFGLQSAKQGIKASRIPLCAVQIQNKLEIKPTDRKSVNYLVSRAATEPRTKCVFNTGLVPSCNC